jgi:hypothetical protein
MLNVPVRKAAMAAVLAAVLFGTGYAATQAVIPTAVEYVFPGRNAPRFTVAGLRADGRQLVPVAGRIAFAADLPATPNDRLRRLVVVAVTGEAACCGNADDPDQEASFTLASDPFLSKAGRPSRGRLEFDAAQLPPGTIRVYFSAEQYETLVDPEADDYDEAIDSGWHDFAGKSFDYRAE